jgi:UDP-sugar pyrophosphorylase
LATPVAPLSLTPACLPARVLPARPRFGTTMAQIRSRFVSPDLVQISERSTLAVEGDVFIEKLYLDGALLIRAAPGARVIIKGLRVCNLGWVLEALEEDDVEADPVEKMRGFRRRELESLTIDAPLPGDVVVDR